MYKYDANDALLVKQRVKQFRDQTQRFIDGKLSDDVFLQLRLRNGLYIQKHAPMLRIAIPYGTLTSEQLRKLAEITDTYDKGYGHFTTRQNLQINWPQLEQVPDILEDLATVEMHAIQTSGNCIRNITTDPLAGINDEEVTDPRPYCELIRQWSTLHPEFYYLPRKFKIAVTATENDRAVVRSHDIGLIIVKNNNDELGFKVLVGGGLGRTPVVGQVINEFVPEKVILSYLEAILRVYNLHGRRDNMYKARIKILVKSMGLEEFKLQVEKVWRKLKDKADLILSESKINKFKEFFISQYPAEKEISADEIAQNSDFAKWYKHNTLPHKYTGFRVAYISLKHPDNVPGDINSANMRLVADIADKYGKGVIRTVADQNLLIECKQTDLFTIWQTLKDAGLAYPNIDTPANIICCPGLDLCSLANAYTVNIAQNLNKALSNLEELYKYGKVTIKMSGCMNACAHHHIANIGILGVDKKGESFYQIVLGGCDEGGVTKLGQNLGKAIPREDIVAKIKIVLDVYANKRLINESFIKTYERLGVAVFKEAVYG